MRAHMDKNVNIATVRQMGVTLCAQRWIDAAWVVRTSRLFTAIIDFPIDYRTRTDNRSEPRNKWLMWQSRIQFRCRNIFRICDQSLVACARLPVHVYDE